MNEHVGQNIQQLRFYTGLNQTEFAEKIGASQSSISNWEHGTTFPTQINIEGIIKAFPDLLLTQDNILSSTSGFARLLEQNAVLPLPTDEVSVPLFGSIAAGKPLEMLPNNEKFPIPRTIQNRYPKAFLLKVAGDSMNRRIPDGAYVLINPTKEVIDGEVYAICIGDSQATLKRVHKIKNGFELCPDSYNESLKPQTYTYPSTNTEPVTLIGKAVWFTMPYDYKI